MFYYKIEHFTSRQILTLGADTSSRVPQMQKQMFKTPGAKIRAIFKIESPQTGGCWRIIYSHTNMKASRLLHLFSVYITLTSKGMLTLRLCWLLSRGKICLFSHPLIRCLFAAYCCIGGYCIVFFWNSIVLAHFRSLHIHFFPCLSVVWCLGN